jgi:hypothetical protein
MGSGKEIRKIAPKQDEVIVNACAIHAIMPSVAVRVLRSAGDHEIATGRGHGSRLREGASGGKIGHFKK